MIDHELANAFETLTGFGNQAFRGGMIILQGSENFDCRAAWVDFAGIGSEFALLAAQFLFADFEQAFRREMHHFAVLQHLDGLLAAQSVMLVGLGHFHLLQIIRVAQHFRDGALIGGLELSHKLRVLHLLECVNKILF